ncbi:MAG: aminotransferase class V-fold PLP-dependent enzyme [Pseudomonadota bacterium]
MTNLANGREYLAIPGPSVIPDRVLRAMHRAAPNIYNGPLIDMLPGLVDDLKSVGRTQYHCAIYIGNGHAAWEAAVSNVFSRGDRALVLATGRFAHGWAEMAGVMGVDTVIEDFGRDAPIDPNRVEALLRADTEHRIKAVMAVQVDTSTSVRNDITALRAAMDAAGHPALLMIDSIACLACDVFEMDAWGVDVMVTGCQKGLMTPPGLSFVYFNDRADAARETANCVTHYWNWRPRTEPGGFYQFFDGTAPTHHLYGLREALDMITEEGLENVWARHATLARAIWAAAEAWGEGGPLRLNIADPAYRSHAVTTLEVGGEDGTRLRRWVEQSAGLTLGIGLGMGADRGGESDGHFRIGHMGHVNVQMVMGALGTIEAGLKAIGVPHGPGGVSAAAQVIAVA